MVPTPIEIRDKRPNVSASLPEYEPFKAIMDRVAIRRIVVETAPDGFIVPEKYRQHTNVGIVVSVGDFVLVGGQKIDLSTVLKPGDKVYFGEYNSEKFNLGDEELELVRVQFIRGVERLKNA